MSDDKLQTLGSAGPLMIRGLEIEVAPGQSSSDRANATFTYEMAAGAKQQLLLGPPDANGDRTNARGNNGAFGDGGGGAYGAGPNHRDAASAPDDDRDGGNELMKLHRMMRGRYLLAFGLAAALGLVGALAGFMAGEKTFRSVGQIRVMPVVPKIMYSMDEKGAMPMFDTYVEAQASLLRSQRVLDKAMDDAAWRAMGRQKTDAAVERFAESLSVSRQGDMIWIGAVDPDPNAARAAVKSLVAAYQKIFDESEELNEEKRQEVLRARQTMLTNELGGIRGRIMAIATEFGTEDLKPRYSLKLNEVGKLETALSEARMALTAKSQHTAATTAPRSDMTVFDIAAENAQMANLLTNRDVAGRQVKVLLAQDLLENNPKVIEARKLEELWHKEVEAFADEYRRNQVAAGSVARGPRDRSEAVLQEQIRAYERMLTDAKAELANLGQKDLQIAELKNSADAVRQRLDETRQRIEQLNVESTITGRISVISDGDRVLGKFRDTRVTYGGAGGIGGIMIGLGAVLLVGLLDGRIRRPDEAIDQVGSVPLLGMLPKLPDISTDPEQAAMASNCVHEIRTLLQIWGRSARRQVLAVTSPVAGAGKTSLTMALGVSFASARYRTLIIDCDFVGAGLSSRAEALAGTTEQSDAAAVAPGMGILDALNDYPLDQCVRPTEVDGMFVLTVGSATPQDIPTLAPEAFHRLMEVARRSFDVVLIDTGPIPGSLEASVVCGEADGVVLVVSRGERRPLIQRSVGHLLNVGARVAGVVFNRATQSDVMNYGSASISSTRRRSEGSETGYKVRELSGASRFGPVARAVASHAPVASPNASSRRAPQSYSEAP